MKAVTPINQVTGHQAIGSKLPSSPRNQTTAVMLLSAVVFRLILFMLTVGVGVTLPGCAASPVIVPATPPNVTQAPADLADAQKDAKAVSIQLKNDAKAILAGSTIIRNEPGVIGAPPSRIQALDQIEAHAKSVNLQAVAIDPALLAKLSAAEQAAKDAVTALANAQQIAVDQAARIKDLESLRSYIPWAIALIVAGCVGMALKLYPPLSWVPGEIGGGVAAAGVGLLVFIQTWATHPWVIVACGVAAVIGLIAPTIIRLNTHPALQPIPKGTP